MSHDFKVEQAEEHLAHRKILAVTAASIVITVIGLVLAWLLLEAWGQRPPRTASPVAPRTIGTLEQTMILETERGVMLRKEQEKSLHRWEWVDRDAGIARIPIEAAIDVMVAHPLPPDRPVSPAKSAAPPGKEPRR
jgi:hypothetical protein